MEAVKVTLELKLGDQMEQDLQLIQSVKDMEELYKKAKMNEIFMQGQLDGYKENYGQVMSNY
jgi:hypothetical protein